MDDFQCDFSLKAVFNPKKYKTNLKIWKGRKREVGGGRDGTAGTWGRGEGTWGRWDGTAGILGNMDFDMKAFEKDLLLTKSKTGEVFTNTFKDFQRFYIFSKIFNAFFRDFQRY